MDAAQIKNVLLLNAENVSQNKSQDECTDDVLRVMKRQYPRDGWYSAKGADGIRYLAQTSRQGSWVIMKGGGKWMVVKRS